MTPAARSGQNCCAWADDAEFAAWLDASRLYLGSTAARKELRQKEE
jgi:hypothetical protein